VTTEDLPFIIADVLGSEQINYKIFIKNYSLSLSYGLKPFASVQIEIDGNLYQETSSGDGQYDAFMKGLRIIYDKLGKRYPVLTDYQVSIPPGGKTDAFVETVITWDYDGKEFKTRGLDADQTESAIKATERMLNIVENFELKKTTNKNLIDVAHGF
jgi:D-citramalate synthase